MPCLELLESRWALNKNTLLMLHCLQEHLPPQPLSGMVNKHGSKVRLTFKLEEDQIWLGTKG